MSLLKLRKEFLVLGAATIPLCLLLQTPASAQSQPAAKSQGQQQDQKAASQAVEKAKSAEQQMDKLAQEGNKLVGKDLYGSQNEKVGEIDNVLVDEKGQLKAILVDVGGFLGIGDKTVAIPSTDLNFEGERVVASKLTKQTAEAMPEFQDERRQSRLARGDQQQQVQDGGAATEPKSAVSGDGSAATLSPQDKEFVEKAAQGSAAEVELGKLAQTKGESPEVKKLGEKLVQDHQQTQEKLKQIAKGVDVPTEPSQSVKNEINKLEQMSGQKFDQEFLQHATKEHKETIDLYEKQAKSGKNQELKSFAESTLPTLKEHMQMAQSARQTADGGSGAQSKQQRQ